jgi:cell division transport system permease protein
MISTNLILQKCNSMIDTAVFFRLHTQALKQSLAKMIQQPIATLLTILVVALALSLPATLMLLFQSIEQMLTDYQMDTQFNVYLDKELSQEQVIELQRSLQQQTWIADLTLIPKKQALASFQQQYGFDDIGTYLDANPLPDVLVLSLQEAVVSENIDEYRQRLLAIEGVNKVDVDEQWVQQVQSFIKGSRGFFQGLMLILGVAILFLIGNTLRLLVQAEQKAIQIIAMVGGTPAFIRRPFLYTGCLYGIVGGVLAALMVMLLSSAVQQHFLSFLEVFSIHCQQQVSWQLGLALIALSTGLSFLGAWVFVGRAINKVAYQYG